MVVALVSQAAPLVLGLELDLAVFELSSDAPGTMRRALEQARGVKKDAAELMGISQRALSHYLAKYRMEN